LAQNFRGENQAWINPWVPHWTPAASRSRHLWRLDLQPPDIDNGLTPAVHRNRWLSASKSSSAYYRYFPVIDINHLQSRSSL